MRSTSPVKRCRQKPVTQPCYRTEADRDPETVAQYFQITVQILEARKLVWLNRNCANSYVIVVYGKEKHRTSIRRNMEDPCYKEYFTFEQYLSIRELQKSNLWMAVMEPRFCAPSRLIGESTIDLGVVWTQPNHQAFHKWLQLTLPRNPSAGAVGLLKVDISIMVRGGIQVMSIPIIVNNERFEDDLLLPTGSEQQPANYIVTVYGVYGLPSGAQGLTDKLRYPKPPTTYVKVSFCGLSVKTSLQSRTNNPFYCEQINIVEMFPNISDVITLEVCNGEGNLNRVLASTHLRLGDVSHGGDNGYLPTFGPSLLHMYGTTMSIHVGYNEDGAFHRGAMLASLKVAVPYYQQELRATCVQPVPSLQQDRIWIMEDFSILCPIFEVSMIDRRICGKSCAIAMTFGELPTDCSSDEEFNCTAAEISNRKLYYTGAIEIVNTYPTYGYLEFGNSFPVLQLCARIPDIRFRMYRNNMVYRMTRNLEQSLEHVERRFKDSECSCQRELIDELNRIADDTAANILKFIDVAEYTNPISTGDNNNYFSTELDQCQLSLQVEEAEKIYEQITKRQTHCSSVNLIKAVNNYVDPNLVSKKDVNDMIAQMKNVVDNLKKLIFKSPEGWPDIVIWLLNNGSRVAYYRVPISKFIHSTIPEQCGQHFGRIHTLCLKPLKCSKHSQNITSNCCCIAAKVEMLLWMAPYREIQKFENHLPKGYKLVVQDYDMCIINSSMILECRAFIYSAKINSYSEGSCQGSTFVRLHALNTVKETESRPKGTKPVWNQVIKILKQTSTTQDRLENSPLKVIVEVFHYNMMNKEELVGRVEMEPVVDGRTDYQFAPRLRWYDIHMGLEHTGQLLMSGQLLPIQEAELRCMQKDIVDLHLKDNEKCDTASEDYEQLPVNLLPKYRTYKLDIYWWGLRDVTSSKKPCVVLEIDELTMKSDVVCEQKCNCNFKNGKSSQIFQASLDEYSPPLSIRLYDSSTFGRTTFLATNVVKNPNKYLVSWIPKLDRDDSLKTVSINTPDFLQVSQILYVKKNSGENHVEFETKKSSTTCKKPKRTLMSKLFYGWSGNDEESYALLPTDKRCQKKQPPLIECCPEKRDWWTRYFASIKDDNEVNVSSADKIVMYGSELEYQPCFSKFKDWCTTLKLYNGKKTGVPEKDDQLYCGFLKAGIVIYKWPPPDGIVAVNCNGVDLQTGYFNDCPTNKPTKFLVRVYIVKGINLSAKSFTGRLDPYVYINCGNKNMGDRKCHVKDSLNPTFGAMYEFGCTMPEDYLLTVSLYDYETVPPDTLIGSTTIDLEDRIYTRHRAKVGLASEYKSTGPCKWRDCAKPSAILEELCKKNHLPMPSYPDSSTVILNGVEYKDTRDIQDKSNSLVRDTKENICLSLLHKWHTFPVCGHHLVPEHVETRTLYNSEKPGVEVGKLQMWVDIFPLDTGAYIPPALDISPPKLEEYELRVVIWDIQGIQQDENEKKVTDIYARAWLDTIGSVQYTDVHTITKACGKFNWRMIFHFLYHSAQKKLVRKEKCSCADLEENVPPIFVLEVLDRDAIVPEDFLASLSFDLTSVPKGAKLARYCNSEKLDKAKKMNLFTCMSTRAWWPLTRSSWNTCQTITVGTIDLELILLPKERARLMPVGYGQASPTPLPLPKITDSDNFMSFYRAKRTTWRREHTLLAITLSVAVLLLLCAYFKFPQKFWNKIGEEYQYQYLD